MREPRVRLALVIANGDIPSRPVLGPITGSIRSNRAGRPAASLIVCADGGARHAKSLGLRPDVILGDLDSVPAGARGTFPGVPILRDPDQESTDLEKAIRFCIKAECSPIVVIGAIGDRLDHSTGALGCFRKFGRKVDLRILDRSGELRLLARSASLQVRPGETFSLIPLTRCGGIVLKGALYPLKGESLEVGVRDGISNRALGTRLSIRHASGWLLIYRLRREHSPLTRPDSRARTSRGEHGPGRGAKK